MTDCHARPGGTSEEGGGVMLDDSNITRCAQCGQWVIDKTLCSLHEKEDACQQKRGPALDLPK